MQSKTIWFVLLAISAAANAQEEAAANDSPRVLQKLTAVDDTDNALIKTQRDAKVNKGATGLDLSLAETPQSVSVIDSETMEDFNLDSINDVLSMATGVNVEAVETDRTYFNARGFNINSMQTDGIGVPFDIVIGRFDTGLYDRVEVVRGANGLLSGTGNPAGAVNYLRKRPKNEFDAKLKVGAGSWNQKRVEADVSAPLDRDGRWSTRSVAIWNDSDSYLNLYHGKRLALQGIIDGQLNDRLTLTAGYTYHQSKSTGVLWGAFPLLYSDGTQTDFDVSASTSMDWTKWDKTTSTSFVELAAQLSPTWQLKTVLSYGDLDEDSELFYTYGVLDRTTGLGLNGNPGKYVQHAQTLLSDTSLSGSFEAWGLRHEATLGLSYAKQHGRYDDYSVDASDPSWGAMSAFPWTGHEIQRPDFHNPVTKQRQDMRLTRLYGATRLSVSEAVKTIVGFNAVHYRNEGESWGTNTDAEKRGVSPYVGAMWQVLPQTHLYASYSDIFEPQYTLDVNHKPIGAATGRSYEAGLKHESADHQWLATVAVFRSSQDNLEEQAGVNNGITYYKGISVNSQGYELEAAGYVLPSLQLTAGYTHFKLRDDEHQEIRTYIPRSTVKLMANWKVPFLQALELGASVRWQDMIYGSASYDSIGTRARIEQSAYALYGVRAGYMFTPHFELNAAVANLSNKKYLTSLMWDQAYYGEPRKVNVSANISF